MIDIYQSTSNILEMVTYQIIEKHSEEYVENQQQMDEKIEENP